jgi:hypothetical protein
MPLLPDSTFVISDEDFNYACSNSEARLFVENLWTRYKEHADKDFAKKIATRFHEHFWEMYLACTLKDNGKFLLPKTKSKGPDIEIKSADFSRIWVEAITASPGTGEDRIPLPKLDDKPGFRVPEDRIVLRYTTAVDAKYQKYIRYTDSEKGTVIEESEPYVIAVNGSKVPYAWDWDDEIPYIVQAVLPFGLPTIETNWDTPEKSTPGFEYRTEIKNVKGEGIPTNTFLRKEYEGISGVIFSKAGIHEFRNKMGNDFIFVHNPLALNRLPEGWLTMGREYRVVGNTLECRRWSK